MVSLLLVAHEPLASALRQVALHAFPDSAGRVAAVDVPACATLEQAEQLVASALEALPEAEVLIAADVFGATPCNAAAALADGRRVRVIAGANVSMIWRTLGSGERPLAEIAARAADGACQGVVTASVARPQNQPRRPRPDDPLAHPDQ